MFNTNLRIKSARKLREKMSVPNKFLFFSFRQKQISIKANFAMFNTAKCIVQDVSFDSIRYAIATSIRD